MYKLICALFATLSIAVAGASTSLKCSEIVGGSLVLKPGTILFVGEQHGSTEVPRVVGDLVCAAARDNKSVLVLLELSFEWNDAFDALFQKADAQFALRDFKRKSSWRQFPIGFPPDGRTSQAMTNLLLYLRSLKLAGSQVNVKSFDTREWEPPAVDSDAPMAAMLVRLVDKYPADLVIVLTGNLHARTKSGTSKFKQEPLAYLAKSARPKWNVNSLLTTFSSGSIWMCSTATQCGNVQQETITPIGERMVMLWPDFDSRGYNGTLYVGSISASPPDTEYGADARSRIK